MRKRISFYPSLNKTMSIHLESRYYYYNDEISDGN